MSAYYLYLPCTECFQASFSEKSFAMPTYYRFLVNAEGIYKGKCECGHEIDCQVQGYNFEILICSAVNSFVQNDFRSAILDMAAAQERFFGFVLDVLVEELKLDKNAENFRDYLRKIKKRSDKELHVFLTLYAARFKNLPFKLSDFEKKAEIRNNVIHNGEMADRKNTADYCEYVIKNIQDILASVLENIEPDVVNKIRFDEKKSSVPARSIFCNPPISWTIQSQEEIENEDRLREISNQDPDFYAEMAGRANQEGKRLWVNDEGKLTLIDQERFPGVDQPKKYCYRTTFQQMLESHSLLQNHFTSANVIDMF